MTNARATARPKTSLGTYYAQLCDESSSDQVIEATIKQLSQAQDRRADIFKIVTDSEVIKSYIEQTYYLDSNSIKQKLNLFSPLFSDEGKGYTPEERMAYDALMNVDCEEIDIVNSPPSERCHNFFSLLIQHSMCPIESLLEKMTLPGIERAYTKTTYQWTPEQSKIISEYYARHQRRMNHPAQTYADFTVQARAPGQESLKCKFG